MRQVERQLLHQKSRLHPIITKESQFCFPFSKLLKTYNTCPSPPAIPTSGVHCEINVDDCNPFTDPVTKEPKCFNKGKCVDRVGGYHCICPAGYVGERCEGDVNECLSNPCDPRGTHSCIQLTNNYRCECRTGYTGKQLVGLGGLGALVRHSTFYIRVQLIAVIVGLQ